MTTSIMKKQFFVHHNSETIKVLLPINATIDDMKFELFLTTGVHPTQQYLKQSPEHENTVESLLSNVLWLSSSNIDDELVYTTSEPAAAQSTICELASASFIYHLRSKYGDNYVKTLKDCSLSEAIQTSCLAPFQYRKMLALYLHNDDLFSKMFCPSLVNGEIRNIFERSFDLIGWNLLSVEEGALENVLDQWTELETVKNQIKKKVSALYILYPYANSFAIFTSISGNHCTIEAVETILKEIENSFQEDMGKTHDVEQAKEEAEPNCLIGSKEFHQMMFDRLGDRDYDSFEADEHMHLKQKIGFAKFGPPIELDYDQKQQQIIEETYQVILNCSNEFSEWKDHVVITFIYNCVEPLMKEKLKRQKKYCDYEPYTDIMPIALFVIRKCTDNPEHCRFFIDQDNRVYSSWEAYKEKNKLHKCIMVLPKNGKYYGNSKGEVQLERIRSPSCSIDHAILQGADTAFSVAGTASGAVFLGATITAITVAPIALTVAAITGISAGIYGIVRSAVAINDRVVHKQTMSFANSQARGAYLNIIAGSMGFIGMGATSAISRLASNGIKIGQGAKAAVNVINAANIGMSAASIASTSYEMIDHWKEEGKITTLSIVQLSTSVLFFGNAVYSFRSANTIIDEAHINTLKKYQDSLSSNRQRKILNKLVKETIRQDGNVQSGRAEVISTLSKSFNSKELITVLTRNNKFLNKAGVRFAAKDGNITFNGIKIDINELRTMSQSQKTQSFTDLPPIPKASIENVKKVADSFNAVFNENNALRLLKYANVYLKNRSFVELAAALLQDFSGSKHSAYINITNMFLSSQRSFEEIQIPTPWGHLAGKWWTPHDKRPIIAFHGWQDNAGSFDRLISYLPSDLGILALDFPGHGLSSQLPKGSFYHSIDSVTLYKRIFKYFNWDKVSLMGHSLGQSKN
ncbi:hypothetical protein RN001_012856 [Aquatica leii]|uniref:DUF4781 domain-containing protein n=1 Tax=Aquatica leii TaxID=1421715 RepID=A0AAN7SFF3_9COLE|nr:hypothetical protein RN001_012856 [Aquatica leii]